MSRRGLQLKGHESEQAAFIFLAALPLVLALFVRQALQNRHATQASSLARCASQISFSVSSSSQNFLV